MYSTDEKIQKRVQEHYDEVVKRGYNVVGVMLQGSQSYNLQYEESDIDTKAIVLPSFEDFILCKEPISTTLVLDNNEHIDVKHIKLMFDCFKKQNINFVEILFTKYKVMNPLYEKLFQPMIDNAEAIARYNYYASLNCMAGMCLEKLKALEHPYPAIMHKIEKYKYDGKQLSHIARIHEIIHRYLNGEKYADCLMTKERDYQLSLKKNELPLEKARILAKNLTNLVVTTKNNYMLENKPSADNEVDALMKKVLIDIMRFHFQEELKNDI